MLALVRERKAPSPQHVRLPLGVSDARWHSALQRSEPTNRCSEHPCPKPVRDQVPVV